MTSLCVSLFPWHPLFSFTRLSSLHIYGSRLLIIFCQSVLPAFPGWSLPHVPVFWIQFPCILVVSIWICLSEFLDHLLFEQLPDFNPSFVHLVLFCSYVYSSYQQQNSIKIKKKYIYIYKQNIEEKGLYNQSEAEDLVLKQMEKIKQNKNISKDKYVIKICSNIDHFGVGQNIREKGETDDMCLCTCRNVV